MKTDLKFWMIVALTLVVIAQILFRPSRPEIDISPYKNAIAIADMKIDSLAGRNRELFEGLEKQILRREQDSASFVARLNAKLARQEKIRVVVMQKVDTMEVVKTFILRSDSIQEDLTGRVRSLEFELRNTTKTLLTIRDNFETEIAFMQDKYKIALQEGEVYRKGWRKEQRKTKVWKIATVIAGVGGLFVSSIVQ